MHNLMTAMSNVMACKRSLSWLRRRSSLIFLLLTSRMRTRLIILILIIAS